MQHCFGYLFIFILLYIIYKTTLCIPCLPINLLFHKLILNLICNQYQSQIKIWKININSVLLQCIFFFFCIVLFIINCGPKQPFIFLRNILSNIMWNYSPQIYVHFSFAKSSHQFMNWKNASLECYIALDKSACQMHKCKW